MEEKIDNTQLTMSVVLGITFGIAVAALLMQFHDQNKLIEIANRVDAQPPHELKITIQQEEENIQPIPMPDLGEPEPIPEPPAKTQPVRVIEREAIVEKQVERPQRVVRNAGTYYPVDPNASQWTVGSNQSPSREELIHHLGTGIHRNKFTLSYLRGLSLAELNSLHGDDHENTVRWEFASYGQATTRGRAAPVRTVQQNYTVQQPIRKQAKGGGLSLQIGGRDRTKYQRVKRNSYPQVYKNQSCPTGNCPLTY